jgi:hypothetical protein
VNLHDHPVGVAYVRMAHEVDPYAIPVQSANGHTRLPVGYANKSLRTRLWKRPGR